MSLTALQNREIDRKVPIIAGQGPSLSLSQACGQLSLVSEGDSEGDVVHLLMWRGRLSVKGTEETCRAMIATPNNLKDDVLAGGAD
jgi:hypothetical protein